MSEMISIWTQNLWLGGDVLPGLWAQSLKELRKCVDEFCRQVVANDFFSRAKRLVKKIAERRPQIVALQEVARISTDEQVFDYLELLKQALHEQGLRYRVASKSKNGTLSFPSDSHGEVTVVDHDVILVNDYFEVTDRGEYHFDAQRPIKVGGEEGFEINTNRGFAWADVVHDHPFRVVNVHLEIIPEEVKKQAYEVFVEIGASPIPVIVTGDFNACPSLWHGETKRYMRDLWLELHAAPGNTFIERPGPMRCDATLYDRDFFEPVQMKLTGPEDWMSDHAGLLSIIGIRKTPGRFRDG